MNKRAGIILGLIIITLGYSAFYFRRTPPVVEEGDTEEVVELTFWRNEGNTPINTAFDELVEVFESKHPNIKIDMQQMHGAQEYELRLRAELAAGNNPDIMTIDSPNLALYANAGELLSLDHYMREKGDIEDILEGTLQGLIFEDELYLAPIVDSSIALYYNKNLFQEAGMPFPSKDSDNPITWEEVLHIAQEINDLENNIYGIDPAQGFGEGEGPAYFKMPLLWQFGAEVMSPDGTTAKGYLNSKEALKALQFYKDLYHEYGVSTINLPPQAFETGKLGMTVLGSWHLTELQNLDDFQLGEDFGIAPLPKGKYQVTPNGGWSLGISSKTDYPDEAWKFVEFVTSTEGTKLYVDITGDIPARYSVADEITELNEYPYNIFVKQGQHYSKNRPVTPAYATVSDTIKTLFEEIVISNRDVEDAADEAVERINRAINPDNKE